MTCMPHICCTKKKDKHLSQVPWINVRLTSRQRLPIEVLASDLLLSRALVGTNALHDWAGKRKSNSRNKSRTTGHCETVIGTIHDEVLYTLFRKQQKERETKTWIYLLCKPLKHIVLKEMECERDRGKSVWGEIHMYLSSPVSKVLKVPELVYITTKSGSEFQ